MKSSHMSNIEADIGINGQSAIKTRPSPSTSNILSTVGFRLVDQENQMCISTPYCIANESQKPS